MAQILVIDDDPTIRLILKRSLKTHGYEVIEATNGEEGITLARQLCPALIICDWMMPIIDGLEVCRLVKAEPTLSATFFILLTARGALEDRVKGLDTGADDFLSKPIEISELQARVRAGLRLHQVNIDLQRQKQILEAEFAEAATYVQSLLPTSFTGKVSLHSRFIPSRQLGGDCFDCYWLDPDYLVMYLLDVSGHGLGAALPSITVLNLLRSQSLPDANFYQPHDVLRVLNETFQMDSQNDKYFTIWYGVYNHAKRQLTYASAGHPPAVLVSPTADTTPQVKQLRTFGLPIGMVADTTYSSERQDVPVNSTLYVFSDGIYDFNQTDMDAWGLNHFIHLLTTVNDTSDLDEILRKVRELNQIDTFDDDLSLLRLNFN
ncbi:SpoIIE family protein phosphatase [Oscillatoria sp. FACHB-1407]|uniref:PP2C family protein-serine/threonine phosphatase n=1 Tax=Oscillatoria sp. FACHB-1407 TaxID=2692847 RepID=UPI0016837B01|nr:SpoIIE family protein phosphatase [Oscillatoria sp. FACHB-1407]MBD2462197.1 SpoIIE family protein phosphatase [Oscillatoria sp. FACHB-1407]